MFYVIFQKAPHYISQQYVRKLQTVEIWCMVERNGLGVGKTDL